MKKFLLTILLFTGLAQADIIKPIVPRVLTKAQAASLLNSEVRGGATALFMQIKSALLVQAKHIWANENGLTPQEAFTALGADQCDARP